MTAAGPEAGASEQAPTEWGDPARRRRLRWRARRGLLENDLLVSRFLDAHESTLTEAEVNALDQLLDLTDNDLLDVVLARRPLAPELDSPVVRSIVQRLGGEPGSTTLE